MPKKLSGLAGKIYADASAEVDALYALQGEGVPGRKFLLIDPARDHFADDRAALEAIAEDLLGTERKASDDVCAKPSHLPLHPGEPQRRAIKHLAEKQQQRRIAYAARLKEGDAEPPYAHSMDAAIYKLAGELDISFEDVAAFKGRCKRVMVCGLLAHHKPGRGRSQNVTIDDAQRLQVAVRLSMCGIPPHSIADIVNAMPSQDLLAPTITFAMRSDFRDEVIEIRMDRRPSPATDQRGAG